MIGRDFCKGLYKYFTQIVYNNSSIPKTVRAKSETVQSSINQIPKSKANNGPLGSSLIVEKKAQLNIETEDIVQELVSNRKLIDIGFQRDDSGSGSDGSEDDIPLNELKKILPLEPKVAVKKPKKKIKKTKGKTLSEIPKILDKEKQMQTIEVKIEAPKTPFHKTEFITPSNITKEEKVTPSSSKIPNFRIKSLKKAQPQPQKDTSELEMTITEKEFEKVDREIQTEASFLYSIREPLRKLSNMKEQSKLIKNLFLSF